MQICRIIIPTVRLATGSSTELSWFRATTLGPYISHAASPCTIYGCAAHAAGLRLTSSQRRIRTGEIQRAAGCPYSELRETFNVVKYGLQRSWLSAVACMSYVRTAPEQLPLCSCPCGWNPAFDDDIVVVKSGYLVNEKKHMKFFLV